jgi:pimeloyl-ACP methyl ester carboxylesterase
MTGPLLTAKDAIELSDGRRLSYSATGPHDGVPVLYLHGAIGSPPQSDQALEEAIARWRIRYLMVDRPGFGGSDGHPGRRVQDFAADVEQLADALGLSRFSVLGVSAGAPYALACAHAMPERIAAMAAVSTIPPGFSPRASGRTAPHYRLAMMALLSQPRAIRSIVDPALVLMRRRPDLLRKLFALGAFGGDREMLRTSEAREIAARRFLAATARGSWPMIEDFLVCRSDWGFELGEIRSPVHLWHGLRDPVIPIAHADQIRRELHKVWPRFIKAGHFLLRERIGEILRPLAKAAARPEHPARTDRLAA